MMAMPLLSAGLAVAQAGAGDAAAKQQANFQNYAWQQNFNASIRAQSDKYASINNNTREELAASDQDLMTKRVDALKAEATARVAAGTSGVNGQSTNAELNDYLTRQGRVDQQISQNFTMKQDHNADELISTNDQTQARINSMQRAAPVSDTPFVFQALGGVLGAFAKTPGYAGGGAFSGSSNLQATG